jgi:hypothetical protein
MEQGVPPMKQLNGHHGAGANPVNAAKCTYELNIRALTGEDFNPRK